MKFLSKSWFEKSGHMFLLGIHVTPVIKHNMYLASE